MRRRSLFVTLSALPLAAAGLLALWQGSLGFQCELNDAGSWVAFGIVAIVTALLVALGMRWAYPLEGLVGLLVGAWFAVVLFFSVLFMGDPEVGSPNLNTLVYFAELAIGLAASWWMLRAARAGWRGPGTAVDPAKRREATR